MNLDQEILSEITVHMKYAKYLPEKQRRETWEELCTRNMEMHVENFPQLKDEITSVYKEYVFTKKVLPSMRSMQFAGKPIALNPTRIFNCSYLVIDHKDAFSEIMFLLLGGTGVGYSVQEQHVAKLPPVLGTKKTTRSQRFVIGDSIEGWAEAIKVLMTSYFQGKTPYRFIYDDIRPKGSKLITSGGKAPGPEPLRECIINIQKILDTKEPGTKLTPIEAHDIICHIADAVLAGGIRRAALIALFTKEDEAMLSSKSSSVPSEIIRQEYQTYTSGQGLEVDPRTMILDIRQGDKLYTDVILRADDSGTFWDLEQYKSDGTFGWWVCNSQRGRANNSAVLKRDEITQSEFFNLWAKIEESRSGEPGIYFTNDMDWGTNPCCEIALRPFQFCNLTEINASTIESQEDFNARARAAAFIGTLQASYTDFHYLRAIWRRTTEKDALIGVSMTGIASMEVFKYDMQEAVEHIKETNARIANIIGIKTAARTTCVKPAGTTSLALGTSSGIHAWHNDYYIRRIRVGKNEAIYSYLKVYHPELVEDDVTKPNIQAVISVPQRAPEGATLRTEPALELLARVKKVTEDWIKPGHNDGINTHNVSATINVKDDEWNEVGQWMWENREVYNGLSVLPFDGGTYKQAPFEDITEERYNQMKENLSAIDLTMVVELDDNTNLSGELACAGGSCEVV